MDKNLASVEKRILNRDFVYEPPYFYNNQLALRCELGIGDTTGNICKTPRIGRRLYAKFFLPTASTCSFSTIIFTIGISIWVARCI